MEKIVHGYMIKSPFVVEPSMGVKEALELMRELEIRHLPVLQDEQLVGIISDRDLREAAALTTATPLKVEDVMRTEIYATQPETPVREIVETMIEEKLGSAVVVNDKKEIIGIFTTIDALRILMDFLEEDSEEDEILLDDVFEPWSDLRSAQA